MKNGIKPKQVVLSQESLGRAQSGKKIVSYSLLVHQQNTDPFYLNWANRPNFRKVYEKEERKYPSGSLAAKLFPNPVVKERQTLWELDPANDNKYAIYHPFLEVGDTVSPVGTDLLLAVGRIDLQRLITIGSADLIAMGLLDRYYNVRDLAAAFDEFREEWDNTLSLGKRGCQYEDNPLAWRVEYEVLGTL